MKHPKPEAWSDYVRGTVEAAIAPTLDDHLNGGCARCERQVEGLKAVSRIGRKEFSVEPPPAALRRVINMFRVQRLLESAPTPKTNMTLFFDSLMAPTLSGSRSGLGADRHLVYESPEMKLELQVLRRAEQGGNAGLQVVGQLTDADSAPIADAPAFLLQGGRISSHGLSSRTGEFHLVAESDRAPQLCLLVGDDQLKDLEIPGFGRETGQ